MNRAQRAAMALIASVAGQWACGQGAPEVEATDPFALAATECTGCFVLPGSTDLSDGTTLENVRVVRPDGEILDGWRSSDGALATHEDIEGRARALRLARWREWGAMTPDLEQRTAAAAAPELLSANGWLNVRFVPFDREDPRDAERASAQEREEVKALLARAERLLRAYPDAELRPSGETPFVALRAPAEALRLLAKGGIFAVLEPNYGPGHPTSTSWHASIGADVTEASGWDGTSVRVALIEGGQPDDYSQLAGVAAIASPAGYADSHMRGTAGVVRAATAPFGVANDVGILVANWHLAPVDVKLWAMQNNAAVVNISWSGSPFDGGPSTWGLHDDWLSLHWPFPLFVLSAGNDGSHADPAQQFVHHKSYNSMKVGAADGRGTETRGDDTMAGFSSWRNPTTTNGDRELPEMSGIGMSVDAAGLTNLTGTSFAAPMVAGAAAVLIERNPAIRSYPEVTKAILMAGADCNVSQVVLNLADAVDDRDGTGNLNVAVSTSIAAPANDSPATHSPQGHLHGMMTFSGTQWSGNKFNAIGRVRTNASGYFRAVLTWNSSVTCTDPDDGSTCAGSPYGPDADLNLLLKNVVTGTYSRVSASRDNNYEVINGSPLSPNASYELEIWKTSAAPRTTSTYYGLAWTTLAPACPDP